MAKLLTVRPDYKSDAERRVVEALVDQLSDAWSVAHAASWVSIDKDIRTDGECDVVVIGPSGLVAIEVKGGRIARNGSGQFTSTDRYGKVHDLVRNPVDQAKSAKYTFLWSRRSSPRPSGGKRRVQALLHRLTHDGCLDARDIVVQTMSRPGRSWAWGKKIGNSRLLGRNPETFRDAHAGSARGADRNGPPLQVVGSAGGCDHRGRAHIEHTFGCAPAQCGTYRSHPCHHLCYPDSHLCSRDAMSKFECDSDTGRYGRAG